MQSLNIQTFNPKKEVSPHSFFVLCKGLNSGKPLKQPCANCFILSAKNNEDKDLFYWLTYSLWQSKAYHHLLCGSVIPFIRIDEYRRYFFQAVNQARAEYEHNTKFITSLRTLEEKESQYKENLLLIQEAKRTILCRYLLKR